ncbi:acetyl-CoA C-acetyltransferase [Vagococcus vulneris]|uniref:acetyl-CoA C-acetyltransferase n=1 Tax=Vagococcus vulneris TaxID=1977869 RepID=A0A430A193_9ENTE|nr:acetyl-CoA C-acetyltransferase [Vagococcus vulneris]RSU00153.1 acetyl-CoA acetyltransferase [Vagococcus vulneris]
MNRVVIVSAKRTPIGKFGGSLKNVSAADLAAQVIEASLKELNLKPDIVDEVILGNVLSAGHGQNIARQAALKSGIPETSSAFTVNKVCGSGMKSVILGAQSIMLGDNQVVIAGGTENMSQANFVVPNHRFGQMMGNSQLVDTMLSDGLTDAFSHEHMGITAENIAEKYGITRQEQDEFALNSQRKAQEAIEAGRFKKEIVPILVSQRRGEPLTIAADEFPRFNSTYEELSKLKAAFKEGGSVTAGNSSGINDGAAILILMNEMTAEKLNLRILGTIEGYASAGVLPELMGTGPIPATQKILKQLQLNVSDLDLVEGNEAFAAQSLSVIKELGLDEEKTNVNGGAIALGHPIGASGARILVTLLHEMDKQEAERGLATLCIGGGQGVAMVISR